MSVRPGSMMRNLQKYREQRTGRPKQAGADGNLARSTLQTYGLGDRIIYKDETGMPQEGWLIKRYGATWGITTSEGDSAEIPTSMVLRRGTPVEATKAAIRDLSPEERQRRIDDCARAYAFVMTRSALEQESQFPTPMQTMTNSHVVYQNALNQKAVELEESDASMFGVHSSLMRSEQDAD